MVIKIGIYFEVNQHDTLKVLKKQQHIVEKYKTHFRRWAETRRAENISAWLGSAWHFSISDEENLAGMKQLCL